MPHLFAEMSLRNKLTAIMLATSAAVLILTSGSYILTEIFSFRTSLINKTFSLAEIIGTNSRTALLLNDQESAEEILAALNNERELRQAYLFNTRLHPFAQLHRSMPAGQAQANPLPANRELVEAAARSWQKLHAFSSRSLDVVVPVDLDGQRLGLVYLQSDLSALRNWFLRFLLGGTTIMGLAILVAYLVAARLQAMISRPILELVGTMQEVSASQDFSQRARRTTGDEIGALIDGFNEMLDRIAERDHSLTLYREGLEVQVAQRTEDLRSANEELHNTVVELDRARLQAVEASKAKSRFLANMSHEIRTPMIGVLGMTEQMLRTGLSEQQYTMARTVHNSGEALLAILNDILDFSKIEAGELELESVPFDLRELLEEILDLFGENAFAKGIELLCCLDPGCPLALIGDPGRLRQILLNLIGNAVKFTARGEIVVGSSGSPRADQRLDLTISVRDTGIGIAPEAQRAIFDSFTQADNSTSRLYGGTGLGLAIVRQLADLLEGRIELTSTPGQGSCFTLTLPMQPQPTPVVPEPPPWPKGERALVWDAHPATRAWLGEQLTRFGLTVTFAASFEETLELLRAKGSPSFAFALLDARPAVRKQSDYRELAELAAQAGVRCLFLLPPEPDGGEHFWPAHLAASPFPKPLRSSRLLPVLGALWKGDCDAAPAAPEEPAPPARQGRLLVAEDNPTTQRLVRLILGGAGYELEMVDNGQDAVACCSAGHFDLVLMDCQMPGMDGFAATAAIREEGNRVPIIALTAHAQREDAERCLEAGMDDYLSKPFRQQQLQEIVAKWLQT